MKASLSCIFALLFILATHHQSFGQAGDIEKFVYCELLGTQKFLSTKVTITVDFGEERNYWKDNRMRDEESGKVKVFNSMVDALNYMGGNGWGFVQAYVVTVSNQNVYHWLLKKSLE